MIILKYFTMKTYNIYAFYKHNNKSGWFECLSGGEGFRYKRLEGKLVGMYPQVRKDGRKRWFVLVLKKDDTTYNVCLDSEDKTVFVLLVLIIQKGYWETDIYLEANSDRVKIGGIDEKKSIPVSSYMQYMKGDATFERAIIYMSQITGRTYDVLSPGDEEVPDLEQVSVLVAAPVQESVARFTLGDMIQLVFREARLEGITFEEHLIDIMATHFLERYGADLRREGYPITGDGLLRYLSQCEPE